MADPLSVKPIRDLGRLDGGRLNKHRPFKGPLRRVLNKARSHDVGVGNNHSKAINLLLLSLVGHFAVDFGDLRELKSDARKRRDARPQLRKNNYIQEKRKKNEGSGRVQVAKIAANALVTQLAQQPIMK